MPATIDLNTVPLDRIPLPWHHTKKEPTTGPAHRHSDNHARPPLGLPTGTLRHRNRALPPAHAVMLPEEAPA